jgi:hypothetical protein
MRFLFMIFLSAFISCGQKDPSTKTIKADTPERQEEYYTDIREVDLLDVAMDVSVDITGNQIVFKQTITNSVDGVRSSCSLGVVSGQSYTYRINGNILEIQTTTGEKMSLKRVSGDSGIVGSWTGRMKSGDQMISRRLTFITENRLVMRTHCES